MSLPLQLVVAGRVEEGGHVLHGGPFARVGRLVHGHHPAHVIRTAVIQVTDKEPPQHYTIVPGQQSKTLGLQSLMAGW